jgi:hypothetical protein
MIIWPSLPGLTRQSMQRRNVWTGRMDARVKPEHDEGMWGRHDF